MEDEEIKARTAKHGVGPISNDEIKHVKQTMEYVREHLTIRDVLKDLDWFDLTAFITPILEPSLYKDTTLSNITGEKVAEILGEIAVQLMRRLDREHKNILELQNMINILQKELDGRNG